MQQSFPTDPATQLSFPQLEQAARLAWRNSNRCIGRLFWKSLVVRDLRHLETEDQLFDSLVDHLRIAFNGGAVRSVISVFAAAEPGEAFGRFRIWNHQLIQYAGYLRDGRTLGDPASVELTERAIALGWGPPAERSAFDVLPWIVQKAGQLPRLFSVPRDVIHEVRLSHPQFGWFEKLGLKWYALPVLSDMCFDASASNQPGSRFPAAPFNGWYMGTEIGARNLGDESRYNLLPLIAEKMGLTANDDPRANRTLWKDRALIELNQAVLHSYEKAGVKLVDHHTAAREFMTFAQLEKGDGREVMGDWSWLVPPISGSATPVFHCPMKDEILLPNFLHQPPAWNK